MTRYWTSLKARSLSIVFGAVLILAPITNSAAAPAPQDASTTAQAGAQAASGVLRLVSFSGVVKEATGKPATGVVRLTLSLYSDQEGGTPLWSETQDVELDDTGHYTVLVGATSPSGLPLDLFTTGAARWLGVQPALGGVGEQPRVLLVGMPYALKAADADMLGGKPASAFVQVVVPDASGSTSAAPTGSQNPNRMNPDTGTALRKADTSSTTPTPLAVAGSGTAVALTYSNANLNGNYSFEFGTPQAYTWSKTFTCPTNSNINFTVNGSQTGADVVSGVGTFDGNGNLSLLITEIGKENQSASANTTSVTWDSSCHVVSQNNGHVVYQASTTRTQTGTYSIQSNGTGTISAPVGSSPSLTLLLAATSGGISTTVLVGTVQVNGKPNGTGIAIRQ